MAFNLNPITIPVMITFIANGFTHLYYAFRLKKKYPQHNFQNSVALLFLWIIGAIMFPFYYSTDNEHIRSFQGISFFFICIFTPFMIFLILFYQYKFVIKPNPEVKKKRCITDFFKEFDDRNVDIEDLKTHSFKTDLHRKTLHLFPASVIIILWIFSVNIWEGVWNADDSWGISGQDFGVFLIITAGYSGILVFAALDYVRLSCVFDRGNVFYLLPDNVLDLLGKAMKKKEFFEFTKPAALVLAFAPTFVLAHHAIGIFMASMLIATIGDGAASLVGIGFGKHHFPKSSKKTIEGYISGFLACFVIVIISLVIFQPGLLFGKILIMALGGASTFLAIDLINLKIDDNILNPICCSIVMAMLFIFI